MAAFDGSLTDMWCFWVETAGPSISCGNWVTLSFMTKNIWPELQRAGFEVPARRALDESLVKGLEDLPKKMCGEQDYVPRDCCSFAHLMNLLWLPMLEYMDACACSTTPEWTGRLCCNHTALVKEMRGLVPQPEEVLDIGEWAAYIHTNLTRLLKVDVPRPLILTVASHVVPFHRPPTRANALHLMRSGLCADLVGPALASQVHRMILSEIAEMPVDLLSEAALALKVRQDLVNVLVPHDGESAEAHGHERPLKRSRTFRARGETMANKTRQVLFLLRNRLPITRLQDVMTGTSYMLQRTSSFEVIETVLCDRSLRTHVVLLDGGLDRLTSETLFPGENQGNVQVCS